MYVVLFLCLCPEGEDAHTLTCCRHSVDITGRRCQLLTERAELSRELTSLRLAMTQLEGDLSRLHGDIARAGMSQTDGTILVWLKMHVCEC